METQPTKEQLQENWVLYKIDYFRQDDYIVVKNLTKEQVHHAFCKTVMQREIQDDDDGTFFIKLENNIKSIWGEIQFFLNTSETELTELKYYSNDNYSEYAFSKN